MDKRFLSEKVLDRMSAYWTGWCIGWQMFEKPGVWHLVTVFIIGLLVISVLDIGLYAIQIRRA